MPGDPQIISVQNWLNTTYGWHSQWVAAPTHGFTGWETIYALTRALQIELNITTLADAFGPTTQSRFVSTFGVLSPSSTAGRPNVVRILQGAMWCKGYRGGWEPGVFDQDLLDSIAVVNANLGLSASVTSVNVKLMKSLLTMDAYTRIGSGTWDKREVQQWLNGKYSHRLDFPLLPCDGIFSRNTQLGLMFAIQYELNMADGVANGNFGPGTKSGLQSSGYVSLGATDSTKNWVRLYQGALRFNDYSTPFSGTFDNDTKNATLSFQGYAELPATGAGTYATWASLLISTGDSTRPGIASDMMTQLTGSHCNLLYQNGYRTVGRYISVLSKRYAPGELGRIFAAGLKTFPIMQEANTSVADFSHQKGVDHGFQALRRLRQLGFKGGTTVFFAVDFDALDEQITTNVIPYFQGVADYLHSTSVDYKVGVYGTRNVCARVINAGLATEAFIASMSWGWSGNLGFKLPPSWSYDQIAGLTLTNSATSLEIDKNVQSSRAVPAGSADVLPTPLVVKPPLTDLQFDEDNFWYLVELDVRAEHATGRADGISADFVLQFLQHLQWQYTEGPWLAYTPNLEDLMPPLSAQPLRDQRASFTAVAPQPASWVQPRLSHWAATLRGYRNWDLVAYSKGTCILPDVGGWAGDILNAWNDYYLHYRSSYSGTLRQWFRDNVGTTITGSRFSADDLRADIDAFLCRMMDQSVLSRPISDYVREIETQCGLDSHWRYAQFYQQRFDGTRATVEAAVVDIFQSGAIWVHFPVRHS